MCEGLEEMQRGNTGRLRVLLITEGTYPFHFGGVSTWCHSLLNGLPQVEFTLMALVSDPNAPPLFQLPPNVVEFRPVSLWGVREVLETRHDLTWAQIRERTHRTNEAVVVREFLPAFRSFLYSVFGERSEPELLAESIHQMHRFFLTFDFDLTFRSRALWEYFVEAMAHCFPRFAALNRYPEAPFSLSDVTKAMQWLYHACFPIAQPLPKVEVAHAAMAGVCTLVAVAAKKEHLAAFLLTEHGVYLRECYLAEAKTTNSLFLKLFRLRFARRMTELSYALADQISPCCDYNQRWERRLGADPDRLRTIPYGVDSTEFTPSLNPPSEPNVVVAWVGRINPLKDLQTLLRAAALVHEARPDVHFQLHGSASADDEPYYQEVLALRSELGLEGAVSMCGYTPNPQVAFNRADIVVLSSISEALPFSVLEAMACAKPVVATAVGGVPEQVEGCGIVVEPRDPRAMAEAILRLANDPEHRAKLGRIAREKAELQYSVGRSAEAHCESYSRLSRALRLRQLVHSWGPSLSTSYGWATERNGMTLKAAAVGHESRSPGDLRATGEYLFQTREPTHGVNTLAASAAGVSLGEGEGALNREREAVATVSRVRAILSPGRSAHVILACAEEVSKYVTQPVDSLEVAAVIESLGITDKVARLRYGVSDSFALAAAVLFSMRRHTSPTQRVDDSDLDKPDVSEQDLSDYVRGPLALIGSLLVIFIIRTYGELGQWGTQRVLSLALGMTLGVLVASGFIQAIYRRGSIYASLGDWRGARQFLKLSLIVTGVCIIALSTLLALTISVLNLLGPGEATVFVLGFVALSVIWPMSAGLGLLQRSCMFVIGLGVGLLAGATTDRLVALIWDRHIEVATAIGFTVTAGLMVLAINRGLDARVGGRQRRAALPPLGYLGHEAAPYFAYGAASMAVVLLPHLLAWLGIMMGPGTDTMTSLMGMEVALTMSLPPVILAGGVAEHGLRLFWRKARVAQEETRGDCPGGFGRLLTKVYLRQLRLYLLVLAGTTLGTYFSFGWALDAEVFSSVFGVPSQGFVAFTFNLSLLAYAMVGWGLFNCTFCITLNQPRAALRAMVLAMVVTVLVGIPLGVVVHFSFVALAFTIGAAAFAMVSSHATSRVLEAADYHYYSSS